MGVWLFNLIQFHVTLLRGYRKALPYHSLFNCTLDCCREYVTDIFDLVCCTWHWCPTYLVFQTLILYTLWHLILRLSLSLRD